MKKALIFAMLASALVMFQRCNNDPGLVKPNASIAFQTSESLPDGATLLLSLESPSGEVLMNFEQVEFSPTGDGFITANLGLAPGHYQVTDLVVVDENDQITFAAPKANAPLSENKNPNLISVGLNSDETSNTAITLYSTSNYQPEDFGYENFLTRTRITLNIGVQLPDGNTKLDAAQAIVLHNYDTVTTWALLPSMNKLSFDAVSGENYTVMIFQDGYSSYRKTVSLSDKSQKPTVAKLKPAFSMVAVTTPQGYHSIELDGWPGALVIDWGDGSSEPIALGDPNDVDVIRDHQYAVPGKYYVNVTGALDQINTLLFSQFEASKTDRVNIGNLPKLYDLRFMYTHTPIWIDASQNHELAFAIFWHTDVQNVTISKVRPPNFIEFEGCRYLTTASFDQVINDVYDYELQNGPRGGFISWLYYPNYPDFSTAAPVGPPSPETIAKMIILENEYSWDFGPDADYDWGSGDPW